MNPAAH